MGCLLEQVEGFPPRLRIAAVLLAAGEGRRMGGVSKPLIRIQGVPLISRQLVAVREAGIDEVVVVTGHARHSIEDQVRSHGVALAHNEAHADGQQRSVRVGLEALRGNPDAVIVMLADQPLIGASDLADLIEAFRHRPAGHVVVPTVNDQRGNPVILDDVALARILASDANLGCRDLIDRQPELVHMYETTNTRFITDLDTVEDVRQLAQRTGWLVELPTLEAVR